MGNIERMRIEERAPWSAAASNRSRKAFLISKIEIDFRQNEGNIFFSHYYYEERPHLCHHQAFSYQ